MLFYCTTWRSVLATGVTSEHIVRLGICMPSPVRIDTSVFLWRYVKGKAMLFLSVLCGHMGRAEVMTTPLILNLSTVQRWVLNCTAWLLYPHYFLGRTLCGFQRWSSFLAEGNISWLAGNLIPRHPTCTHITVLSDLSWLLQLCVML